MIIKWHRRQRWYEKGVCSFYWQVIRQKFNSIRFCRWSIVRLFRFALFCSVQFGVSFARSNYLWKTLYCQTISSWCLVDACLKISTTYVQIAARLQVNCAHTLNGPNIYLLLDILWKWNSLIKLNHYCKVSYSVLVFVWFSTTTGILTHKIHSNDDYQERKMTETGCEYSIHICAEAWEPQFNQNNFILVNRF